MPKPIIPDDDALKLLSFDELQQLDYDLSRAARWVGDGAWITTEHGRVLDELESRPALVDVYDEQASDMQGRRVFIRHKREDLIEALRRLDADLARDLDKVPQIPLYVARALVHVKQYDDRWGDSDHPHAMIGEEVTDSLDAIEQFRDEHQKQMQRDADRQRRRALAKEACRRIRSSLSRTRYSIARASRDRSHRRHVVRASATAGAIADPDPEPPSTAMFDVFETEIVAADGVWAVTFERLHGFVDWGDVTFIWIARAVHYDGRKHVSWLALSGILGVVLKRRGFDPETVFEIMIFEYRRRFDRLVTEPGAKTIIDQGEYEQLLEPSPKPLERIGREIERLCFFISSQLAGLRRFKAEGGGEMVLALPDAVTYELESVVLDELDKSITTFYDDYRGLIDRAVGADNASRTEVDLRRALRRGAVAARKIFSPPPPPPAAPTPTTPASGTQPETPSVPGYELVERLGEGGYGVVYRARDAAGVERAIKLLSPLVTVTHANTRERFLREALALSRLDHRNLVKYLQLAEGPSGWYLIMELVRGSNLSRWAHDHAHIERAAAVAPALDGLAYMHEQGVIHRDLKPSNIMVEASTGRTVIVDFGLAWIAEDAGEDLHTRASTWSAAYAPPESIASPEQSRSPLHDIYSMGVVLYEVLAGNRRGLVDGIPLSAVDVNLAPLDPVIEQATARADRRFQTAAEFANALRASIKQAGAP